MDIWRKHTLSTNKRGVRFTHFRDSDDTVIITFGEEFPCKQIAGSADLRELADYFHKLADAIDAPHE